MVAEKDSVSPAELLAELKLIYDFPTGKGSVSSGIFRSATIAVDGRAQAASDPYESNKRVKFTDQGSIVVSAEEKIETHDGCDVRSKERDKIFEHVTAPTKVARRAAADVGVPYTGYKNASSRPSGKSRSAENLTPEKNQS